MTRFYTYCMLRMPRGWANLRGGREGRVVHLWVSQATTLDCTGVKLDTPPAVLVAPNGYRGFEARIYKCGGHQALSHLTGHYPIISDLIGSRRSGSHAVSHGVCQIQPTVGYSGLSQPVSRVNHSCRRIASIHPLPDASGYFK